MSGALTSERVGSASEAADEELVARSRGGDRAAFEQLVRRTARMVYARQYLETHDAHRAEDLAQETYLLAWRSIGQLAEASGFRAWLLSIARSVATDAYRRDARKKRNTTGRREDFEAASAGLSDPTPPPDEAAALEEKRRRVAGALKALPEEYGLPLTLRFIAGADYDTIGRQLGLSNGSLRGLLSRGMAKLREALKNEQ